MKSLNDIMIELYEMGELRNVRFPSINEEFEGHKVRYTYSHKLKYLFIEVSNGTVKCKCNLPNNDIEATEQQKINVLRTCIKKIKNFK